MLIEFGVNGALFFVLRSSRRGPPAVARLRPLVRTCAMEERGAARSIEAPVLAYLFERCGDSPGAVPWRLAKRSGCRGGARKSG